MPVPRVWRRCSNFAFSLAGCRNSGRPSSLTCYDGEWLQIEDFLVKFVKAVAPPTFKDVAEELVFFADRIIRSCNNEVCHRS